MTGSSEEIEAESSTTLQPFQCLVCFKKFTRHENLRRHSAIHRSTDAVFKCEWCSSTFARKDLRKRHVDKKHAKQMAGKRKVNDGESHDPGPQPNPQPNSSPPTAIPQPFSDATASIDTLLAPSEAFSSGWTPFDFVDMDLVNPASVSTSSAPDLDTLPRADFLTPQDIEGGVRLYFDRVSHCFPFLHRPTFDPLTAPQTLILGMLSLSLQFRDAPGRALAQRCYHYGSTLLLADTQSQTQTWILEPALIQAHLLLQCHAILCACGQETRHGLHLLNRSVELARNGGLMESLPKQPPSSDLDSLWRQFVREETHKRTAYAVFQLDAIWYQTFSRPRLMSHLEIKHDLPCNAARWDAETGADWAHASLTSPDTSLRYIDAVRAALLPDSSRVLLGFGPLGTQLVLLFILSSVREVSGWATMTGKLCTDRFEVMHSSLEALGPVIRRQSSDPASVSLEATWHMAMMELLLWSATHTGGLVETTLEAALAAAASLSFSNPIALAPQTAEALDTHLTWFLQLLTGSQDPNSEAPWVTMYAFKATLVAWQLARDGAFDLDKRIGVHDLAGMQAWMRVVFGKRTTWSVSRLVIAALSELEGVPSAVGR